MGALEAIVFWFAVLVASPLPAGTPSPPLPHPSCEVVLSEPGLHDLVAEHDWGSFSSVEITRLFMLESWGGCVDIVSPTDDWGCTQIHRTPARERRWSFARIKRDCAYAVRVANVIFHERLMYGRRGISAWYAGENWLW